MAERRYERDRGMADGPVPELRRERGDAWWREELRHRGQRRDYRYAGETALGRPDWGDVEGTYAERHPLYASQQAWLEVERRWWQGERPNNAGRGPRNYRRSDERIFEDVSEQLTQDAVVDATAIEVTVVGGEVLLAGLVGSRDEKRRAEDIAESVSGVSDVNNDLRIASGGVPGPARAPLEAASGEGESQAVPSPEPAERDRIEQAAGTAIPPRPRRTGRSSVAHR